MFLFLLVFTGYKFFVVGALFWKYTWPKGGYKCLNLCEKCEVESVYVCFCLQLTHLRIRLSVVYIWQGLLILIRFEAEHTVLLPAQMKTVLVCLCKAKLYLLALLLWSGFLVLYIYKTELYFSRSLIFFFLFHDSVCFIPSLFFPVLFLILYVRNILFTFVTL